MTNAHKLLVAQSGRHPDPRAQSKPKQSRPKRRHMRRVHFPLRSGNAWLAYKIGLPLSPRTIFSGIQPTSIPHVRRFFFPFKDHVRAMLTVGGGTSWEITFERLRTGSSYSLPPDPVPHSHTKAQGSSRGLFQQGRFGHASTDN